MGLEERALRFPRRQLKATLGGGPAIGWAGVLAVMLIAGAGFALCAQAQRTSPEPGDPSQRQPHKLTITVVDASQDRAVAGATFSGPFLRSSAGFGWGSGTVTDERGVAVLSISFPGVLQNYSLSVWHSNYAPREVTWTAPPDQFIASFPTNYTVKLARTLTVGGFVRDERGKAISGARLALWAAGQSMHDPGVIRAQEQSIISRDETDPLQTDANGFWTQKRFPVDLENATMEVVRPGGATSYFTTSPAVAQGPVQIGALRSTNAVLTLPDGVTVRGIVIDESGQPVSDVRLKERGGRMNRTYVFTNQADGRFELTHRTAAQILIAAESPRHALKSTVLTLEGTQPEVRIVLPRLRPARLRVLDDQDEPVSGARVQPVEWRNPGLILDWNDVTDAEGRMVWTNAPAERAVIMIAAPRYPARMVRLTPREEELVVHLRSEPEKSMQVRVKAVEEGTGRPVPGFTVLRAPQYSQALTELGKAGADGILQSVLDARGLQYQQFGLNVRADGYSLWTSDEQFVSGEGDLDLTVELKKARPPAGVVLRPDGQPAANARVILNATDNPVYSYRPGDFSSSGQPMETQSTGPDGSFRFAAAADHHRLIVVHSTGFAALSVEQLLASGRIPLQSWARVEGVLGSGGKPVPRDRVSLKTPLGWMNVDSHSFSYSTTTDKAGRFVFTNIPPGEHVLHRVPSALKGPTTESHRMPVTVKAGETKRVDYTLGGRVVTGLVDADGEVDWTLDPQLLVAKQSAPPPEPFISGFGGQAASRKARRAHASSPAVLDHERKRQQFQLVFDKEGGFRADDVPPGTYELRLRVTQPPDLNRPRQRNYYGERPQVGALSKEITVPPGAPGTEVDLGSFEMAVQLPAAARTLPIAFQATTLDGKAFDLASLRGRPAVLVFWAAWAPQSAAKLAELRTAVEQLGSSPNAAFVTINLDDDLAAARRDLQGLDKGWKHARLEGSARFEVTERLPIDTLPVTLLLDADGTVIGRDISGRRLAAVLSRLDRKRAKN